MAVWVLAPRIRSGLPLHHRRRLPALQIPARPAEESPHHQACPQPPRPAGVRSNANTPRCKHLNRRQTMPSSFSSGMARHRATQPEPALFRATRAAPCPPGSPPRRHPERPRRVGRRRPGVRGPERRRVARRSRRQAGGTGGSRVTPGWSSTTMAVRLTAVKRGSAGDDADVIGPTRECLRPLSKSVARCWRRIRWRPNGKPYRRDAAPTDCLRMAYSDESCDHRGAEEARKRQSVSRRVGDRQDA